MGLPDSPLKPEAQRLFEKIIPQINEELSEIKKIPVSILLWGPSPYSDSPISDMRKLLRDELRKLGHLALFSEEIVEDGLGSIRIQQLVQAQKFDMIVSIPESPGSIAEIHDFAGDARVNGKLLVFLNNEYIEGYSHQSLQALSSILTYEVIFYNGNSELNQVKEGVLNHVYRLREVKYFYKGRL